VAHDLVIRNGTLVDGTGAPARGADVAVDGDRVVAVGRVDGSARRTIDAAGRLVTPGFVDLHTHLDAQLGWDPLATSSCWHGVTTVVLGNCGVTFAPVRPGDRAWLAELMESVEDIPADAILDGMAWDWHTYGEFLDSLSRRPLAVNAGGYVGHCALRWYAMGERSLDEAASPDPDELDVMVRLVDEAVASGALGLSTSRTLRHRVPDGCFVPGTFASPAELAALASPLARHGRGVVGISPRFDGEGSAVEKVESELAWMVEVARATGRPVTFNLTQTTEQGDHWRRAIELAEAANRTGATVRPQTTPRGIGVLFCLDHHTPFDHSPAWQALRGRPVAAKLAAFADPVRRVELEAGAGDRPGRDFCERLFVLTPGSVRYDPDPTRSLAAEADRRGCSPAAAYMDLCLEHGGEVVLSWPILNHDFACIAEMITNPTVLLGLADAGAHVGQIMDASQPSFLLAWWARDRGLLSIEEAVRRLTSDTAGFAGIADRGVVRPGAFADLNVIDLDALALELPRYVHDLPGGAGRFVQRASGYHCTVVNGVVTFVDGEHTGEMAGRVVRSGG
jgi:N-acyl-D-aspartate/D-glutamate deacylase